MLGLQETFPCTGKSETRQRPEGQAKAELWSVRTRNAEPELR
jgi:hypothetical protein